MEKTHINIVQIAKHLDINRMPLRICVSGFKKTVTLWFCYILRDHNFLKSQSGVIFLLLKFLFGCLDLAQDSACIHYK